MSKNKLSSTVQGTKTLVLPTFLIIGAAKSGTTSVNFYLNQHPEIFMSPLKETEFFINVADRLVVEGPNKEIALAKGVKTINEYQKLFSGVTNETAIGETTPGYLYHPWVARVVRQYIPKCKIIAILRNPVDRAFSHFKMLRRSGLESHAKFLDAIKQEDERISKNWGIGFHYMKRGFYYTQLKRYYDLFDSSQIKVILFDDLEKNEKFFFSEIFDFLNVDKSFVPDTKIKLNTGNLNKSRKKLQFKSIKKELKQNLFKTNHLRKKNRLYTNKYEQNIILTPEERKYISPIFRDEIILLENLINRNLSSWLEL